MGVFFLIILTLVTLGIAWRRPAVRRDMLIAGLGALPFLLIQPLVSGDVHLHLTHAQIFPAFEHLAWVIVLGALAGGLYVFLLHSHLTPMVHPRRGLMIWLVLGPLAAVGMLLATKQPLLICFLLAIGLDLILILLLKRVLVWDTLGAMLGGAALYLFFYLFFGQILRMHDADSGLLILGHPIEDLLLAGSFGALWGPLFSAFRALEEGDTPFLVRHHIPKQVFVLTALVALATAGVWFRVEFVAVPKVLAVSPQMNAISQSLIAPITIQLDRPFDRAAVKLEITPPIEGDVSFEDSYLQRTFLRRIVFTPRTYFQPDTTYTVVVTSLKSIIGHQTETYTYHFSTPTLPKVAAVTPPKDQTDVAICDPLKVVLDQPATKLSEISFEISPAVAFTSKLQDDQKTYILTPKDCLAQSQAYTLSTFRRLVVQTSTGQVLSTGDPISIEENSFTTKGAPGITSVAPQGGGVLVSTKEVVIGFTEPMEQADLTSYLSIDPPIAGSWSWRDPQTAVYGFSTTLPFDTQTTIVMKQGLNDQKGGFLNQDASFSFITIGHVQVTGISPYPGSVGVKSSASIRFSFDQPVDHASAEAHFGLSPAAANGGFTWADGTLIYKADLDKDTSYTATLGAGIESTIGLPLAVGAKGTFQTEESETLLDIPVYYQQHALSCEVASLKMALGYKGINVSEDQLLAALPTDSDPRDGNNWADPNRVFVGDVNGKQDTTGYGVYAGPVLQLANNYRSAQSVNGWSVQDLAQSIVNGNPVVIWGTAGSVAKDSWVTPAGKQIDAWIGEHARTIVGFTGLVSNPSSFIINDPISGRLRWSTSQLKENWGVLGNMGVAIL